MIPVLGVPVLNRPELLDGLVSSIDHEVRQLYVIDNGDVVPDPWAPDGFNRIRVLRPGVNLGVAASWNFIIKANPKADWWLIANSDLRFGPGDLANVASQVEDGSIYRMVGFAAFVITPGAVAKIGWFDENFINGYCEDIDYQRRAILAGVPLIDVPSSITHVGSATIYGDEFYMQQNGTSYPANLAYYQAKWGGRMHVGETFASPFNGRGEVGLELGRLRDLSWITRAELDR